MGQLFNQDRIKLGNLLHELTVAMPSDDHFFLVMGNSGTCSRNFLLGSSVAHGTVKFKPQTWPDELPVFLTMVGPEVEQLNDIGFFHSNWSRLNLTPNCIPLFDSFLFIVIHQFSIPLSKLSFLRFGQHLKT